MSIVEAIILGFLQGLTEFLPVSSSGHLVLVPALLGMSEPSLNVVAIAHLGTLMAVLIYFAKDLWQIITAALQGLIQRDPWGNVNARLGWYILVGSIPAGVLGLTLRDFFDNLFATPTAAALFLLVTAAMLVAGEMLRSGLTTLEKMSWLDGIIIGLFQALALFPGISRSGSTIVGGLLRGLNREVAARYSFLLGIPAILGAGLLTIIELAYATDLNQQIPTLVITFFVAGITGFACIHFLLQWVKQRSLTPFAIYCVVFSLVSLAVFAF